MLDGLRKEEEESSEYSPGGIGESESKGGREGAPRGIPPGHRNCRLRNGKREVKLEAASMWLL